MKRCLTAVITFICLFSSVCGQSPSAAIDSLIKFRVITAAERPVLEKELKEKHGASYRVAILAGLNSIMLQKIFHADPHKGGMWISYGKIKINKKSQDSTNKSLRLLLDKINRSDLLTNRVYTYTLKDIDSGSYVAELQLISSLTEMSSRLEWLAPKRLMPVAEQLHKKGIASDSDFTRLKNDINDGKIESAFQLNEYCSYDRIFDLAKYPDDPHVWLEQIHRDMASIMPGLSFTDFSYTEIPDTSFSIPGTRFKVNLTCNGHTYKYISFPFNNYRNKQGKITPEDLNPEDFYRIFNKVLTDQQSPYRLHSIMFTHSTNSDDLRRFALIALKDTQAEIFSTGPCLYYMIVSMDGYNNTLTSARIDSAITEWKEMGIFSHLSAQQISKATDDAKADYLFTTDRLLHSFPGGYLSVRFRFYEPASSLC